MNAMRKKIIAGNWKMNKDIHESAAMIADLRVRLKDFKNEVGVVICPPFTSLVVASTLLKDLPVKLGAQNMSQYDDGAYTGEISARMLLAVGCEYVIIGHSERRQYFKENDDTVNAKVKKALSAGLIPIACVGETLEEREKGLADQVVTRQVGGALHELSSADAGRIVIAYEPVWAIGTGKTATPDQANSAHKLIRKTISRLYSWAVAEAIPVQYGGSVTPANAYDLLAQSDIDGALVGGASLKPESFMQIVQAGVEGLTST
jgi:triosephosphate isomerase